MTDSKANYTITITNEAEVIEWIKSQLKSEGVNDFSNLKKSIKIDNYRNICLIAEVDGWRVTIRFNNNYPDCENYEFRFRGKEHRTHGPSSAENTTRWRWVHGKWDTFPNYFLCRVVDPDFENDPQKKQSHYCFHYSLKSKSFLIFEDSNKAFCCFAMWHPAKERCTQKAAKQIVEWIESKYQIKLVDYETEEHKWLLAKAGW